MGFKAMTVSRAEEYSGKFTDKDRIGLSGNYRISEYTRRNGEIHNYDVNLNINLKFNVDEKQKDKWKCIDEINKIIEEAVTLVQEQVKKSEYKVQPAMVLNNEEDAPVEYVGAMPLDF